MIRSLYSAVSGMIVQQSKEDVITNNMTNAETNGFKGDNLMIKNFKDVLISNSSDIQNGKNIRKTIGSISLGSDVDATATNFTQGSIASTDSEDDFAIDGRGFFTVNQGAGSQNYYTRDGHFHVNMQGDLMDESNNNVMGKNIATGNVEKINVGNGKLTSDSYGNLSVNGKPSYSFSLVDFSNYNSLKKVGNNLYSGTSPILNANVSVQQKALEGSNVNSVNEMVDMMSTMRNFQTDQKVVAAINQTLGQAVNEVGKV